MVHVRFGPLEEKEGVVVDELLAAVQVHECGDVAAFCVVQQVGGFEVEVAGPEVEGFGEIGDGHAKVAEFVDLGRACWGYVRWGSIWDGVCGCSPFCIRWNLFAERCFSVGCRTIHGQAPSPSTFGV